MPAHLRLGRFPYVGSPDPEVAVPGPESLLGTSTLYMSFTSSVSLRWCRPAFLKPVSWRHNTWRKRKSPAPSRYGRGAVGQLGVLSLPMQRTSFPFGLGPPLGQGWRAVKGPGPSRTSGWLVFCRLDAVYVVSENSNLKYESTIIYYTILFVFCQVILAFRRIGCSFSSGREMSVIRVTREFGWYGPIGQQAGMCQRSTLKARTGPSSSTPVG